MDVDVIPRVIMRTIYILIRIRSLLAEEVR